jgi:hypothetical protein
MRWVSLLCSLHTEVWANTGTGKVGMSVLTKGLAMDFVRQGTKDMAITSIWPAVVRFSAISAIRGAHSPFKSIESAATEATTNEDPNRKADLRKPVSRSVRALKHTTKNE